MTFAVALTGNRAVLDPAAHVVPLHDAVTEGVPSGRVMESSQHSTAGSPVTPAS
jgi:hypothetical protein